MMLCQSDCARKIASAVAGGIALCAAAWLLAGCTKKSSGAAGFAPVVQVVAVEATRQVVKETLPLVGTITANEMVEIKSETDGIVQEILFQEGEAVAQGHLLVRLDDGKFAASLAEAEANFRLSQANLERAQQLFKDKLISQQEFDQTAASFALFQASLDLKRRQLQDTRIVAPFGGLVSARMVSPGQVITRNTILTWLVDLDPVKVEVHVPERFLSQLQLGQTLEFLVAAYHGQKYQGPVYFVSPYVDPENRTALVKARIQNPSQELKPGMFANLELILENRQGSLVIPEAALSQILEEDQARVFVVDSSETAQLRTLKLGLRLAGQVEVLSGLETGERVVVEGIQKIAPGSKVKFAPAEAAAPYELPKAAPATSNAQKAGG